MKKKKLYFIGHLFESKNGWAIYTSQVKHLFGQVTNLNDIQFKLETDSGKKKAMFRILFQLALLPSLWIDTLLNRKLIKSKIATIEEPDVFVLDHFQYWWLIFFLRKRYPKVEIVLISHNLEFRNKWSYVKYAPVAFKVFAMIEYPVVLLWEWLCSKKADLITSINSDEKKIYDQWIDDKQTLLIPPYFKDSNIDIELRSFSLEPKNLLLVGSYGYKAKNLNALWIAKQMHEIATDIPNINLKIVGRGATDDLAMQLNSFQNVEFLGEVEDLSSIYQKSLAVIVPERLGGGFKLKILEAISNKKPMIIHNEAVKGTGLVVNEDCLIFEDKNSLKIAITQLFESEERYFQLAKNAHDRATKIFDQKTIVQKLETIFL